MNRLIARFVFLSTIIAGVFVLLVGAASARAASTIAYWQFNADSTSDPTTFTADSAALNTLTNGGAVSSTNVPTTSLGLGPHDPSPNPDSASFNGSAYMHTSSNLNLAGNTAITIEWFMKQATSITNGVVFEDSNDGNLAHDGAFLGILDNSSTFDVVHFSAGVGSNDHVTFTIPNDSQWHHYALVLDNSNPTSLTSEIKLYVDDTQVAFASTPGVSSGTDDFRDDVFNIGARADGNQDGTAGDPALFFNGLLDEMRITSGALAPGQFLDDTFLPEPASLSLLGVGAILCLRRRRTDCRR